MTSSIEIQLANESIAKHVAETLDHHYPCHLWAVNANVEAGIVAIHNLACSSQWGYVLHIDDMAHDPDMRLVMRAGGEILERFKLSRGYYKDHELRGRAINLRGELIHET